MGGRSSRVPRSWAKQLARWEHEYNHGRLHLALGGRTLAERLCELRISTPLAARRSA